MATATAKRAPVVQVTLADFDAIEPFRVVRDKIAIGKFTPYTLADYAPRDATPLRDAVGKMIAHLTSAQDEKKVTIGMLLDRSGSMIANRHSVVQGVNEFIAGMAGVDSVDPEAAGKVLCVILTDGLENASREFSPSALAELIRDRENNGWSFIYLGANQDAWATGQGTGFSGGVSGQSVSYAATPMGTTNALRETAKRSESYLTSQAQFSAMTPGQSSVSESGVVSTSNLQGNELLDTDSTYGNIEDALKQAKEWL